MPLPGSLRNAVLAAARRRGFELVGIAAADDFPLLRHFTAWIANGYGGEMRYLERRKEEGGPYLREDVRHSFPWARSVVCCGLLYHAPAPKAATATSGSISRYAWGDDYHQVLEGKLRALAEDLRHACGDSQPEARVYVDTGPILERAYARQAGLGWIGKNTCLIHERSGSYFFLGVLICSEEIAPDSPVADRCGSCNRCIVACPTEALRPYEMDASRCIAYLNLELRGPIPEPLRAPMGEHIVGCDICQDVCPWNRRAPFTLAPELQPRPEMVHPELEELASLDEAAYRQRFRGSAAKRAKYSGLRRNLAVAMGNRGDARFRPILEEWASSAADGSLREHALWALRRLNREEMGDHATATSPAMAKAE